MVQEERESLRKSLMIEDEENTPQGGGDGNEHVTTLQEENEQLLSNTVSWVGKVVFWVGAYGIFVAVVADT